MSETTYDLWITEDQELHLEIAEKHATTGADQAAVGLTDLVFVISATKGGSALAGQSWTAAELSGRPGTYKILFDTDAMQAAFPEGSYPDKWKGWLVLTKNGDIESRSWRLRLRRQRVGDG